MCARSLSSLDVLGLRALEPVLPPLSLASLASCAVVEATHPGDGFALRRRWASDGSCPTELLVSDPYGQVAFRGPRHSDMTPRLTHQTCSWRLRPGLFLKDGFMSDMTGPITLTFTAFSLSPYESLEVWSANTDDISFKRENDVRDATAHSPLQRVPPTPTSTRATSFCRLA